MISKSGLILLLSLFACGLEVKAAEMRIPLYAFSEHYNQTCIGKCMPFNNKHRMAGIEINWNTHVAGLYRYIDSYRELSIALYTGQEFAYKNVFVGYHLGVTEKGVARIGETQSSTGYLPIANLLAGLKYEAVHVMLGYQPVPKELGASVGFIRFSFRIKDLGL